MYIWIVRTWDRVRICSQIKPLISSSTIISHINLKLLNIIQKRVHFWKLTVVKISHQSNCRIVIIEVSRVFRWVNSCEAGHGARKMPQRKQF